MTEEFKPLTPSEANAAIIILRYDLDRSQLRLADSCIRLGVQLAEDPMNPLAIMTRIIHIATELRAQGMGRAMLDKLNRKHAGPVVISPDGE